MFATSGSSALSTWLFLITSVITTYRTAGQPLQWTACSQPDNFTVQITENVNVVVYGTELLIKYNPRAGIYPLPDIDAVNVVYNESTIEFTGYMLLEYPMTIEWKSPEKLSWTSRGIILGTGTLQKLSRGDYAVQECRLFLPKNIKSSDNLPFPVKNEIANYARHCIEEYLCRRLEPIKTREIQNTNKYHISRSATHASYAIASNDSSQQNCTNSDTVYLDINEAVNLVIRTAVNYIKHNNKSTVILPNVNEVHELGPFGVKCYFQAINGIFMDLSTLKKTENAYISSVERKHVVKLDFGLGIAKFHYNYYKIKYGIMVLNGKVTGSIDGLAISISLLMDYDKKCPMTLQYFKVTEFGNIKIQMTGLGPINTVTSSILSWLTNMWRNNFVSFIQINVKHAIEKLNEKICTNNIVAMFH